MILNGVFQKNVVNSLGSSNLMHLLNNVKDDITSRKVINLQIVQSKKPKCPVNG